MKLPYYIKYKILGSVSANTTGCRTIEGVKHIINEIKNYTLISFETNAPDVDISELQIIGSVTLLNSL